MTRSTLTALALCTAFGFTSSALAEGDAEQRMAEGRTVIKAFAGELTDGIEGRHEIGWPRGGHRGL